MTRMSMEFCVLASGSSGNCSVVRTDRGVVLLDCGIGPRTAERRLRDSGVLLDDVAAICLTHPDSDHFNFGWIQRISEKQIPVFCHAGHVNRLAELCGDTAARECIRWFESERFEILPGLSATTVKLAHDEEGSHAFCLEGFGTRIGYATDLGHVPRRLIEQFCGLDVLAIESNYDPHMQRASGRPMFLQSRITGGRGHLSNEQALEAVRTIFDRCEAGGHRLPGHVVLLHRSRQCNCPKLLREWFSRDARLVNRVTMAEQHCRTEWLTARADALPGVGEQLVLGWA